MLFAIGEESPSLRNIKGNLSGIYSTTEDDYFSDSIAVFSLLSLLIACCNKSINTVSLRGMLKLR